MSDDLVRYESSSAGDLTAMPNLSLSILNPLGGLGRLLGEILAYRVETRRAQRQLNELRARVELASLIVDAHTSSQLLEMELRARAVEGALSIASSELGQRARTAEALIEALKSTDAQLNYLLTSGTAQDRKMAMEMKAEMAHILADFTVASSQGTLTALRSVQSLAGHTARDLIKAVADTRRAIT